MDDPNAALPSDPTVDESYTKGSRPVRPRHRSSAPADAAGRSSRADSAPATQRPTRGRAPGPQASGEVPAGGPQPRRLTSDSWYRRKLARRLGGVATCLALTMLISHVALATAPGQVLDTILMEGTMRSASRYEAFSTLITGIVSVPVMAAAGIVVALVAAARRRPTLAGRALGAVIGANITTQILKDQPGRHDECRQLPALRAHDRRRHPVAGPRRHRPAVVPQPLRVDRLGMDVPHGRVRHDGRLAPPLRRCDRRLDRRGMGARSVAHRAAPPARRASPTRHGVGKPRTHRHRAAGHRRRHVGLQHVSRIPWIRIRFRGLPADPSLAFARPRRRSRRMGERRVRPHHARGRPPRGRVIPAAHASG